MTSFTSGDLAFLNRDVAPDYNVREYGAKGDGVTDDTAAIQAAINAAAAAGGGAVYLPAATYMVKSLNLLPAITLKGEHRDACTLSGTGGYDVLVLPASGTFSGFRISDLTVINGQNSLVSSNITTFVVVDHCHFVAPADSCINITGAIEEWYLYNVQLEGGQYGFRHQHVVNSQGNNYIDKCTFINVLTNGQAVNCWNIQVNLSTTVSWLGCILNTAGQHGFYADGGIRCWTFLTLNTEGNGQTGKMAQTTGSIASGSSSLSVVSAAGLSAGDPITIQGAGTSGQDLTTTITNIAGTTITLAAPASSTISGGAVTNAQYDDVVIAATIGAPQDITFISCQLGGLGTNGHLRYSLNNNFGTLITCIQCITVGSIPIYDPSFMVQVLSGQPSMRQPTTPLFLDRFVTSTFPNALPNAPSARTLVTSPAGNDIVFALVDSHGDTTGTYGLIRFRRFDPNRTQVASIDANGMFITGGIATKVKAGTPTDADFLTVPPDGTIVVDTSASKIWTRVGGVWKGVAVA